MTAPEPVWVGPVEAGGCSTCTRTQEMVADALRRAQSASTEQTRVDTYTQASRLLEEWLDHRLSWHGWILNLPAAWPSQHPPRQGGHMATDALG